MKKFKKILKRILIIILIIFIGFLILGFVVSKLNCGSKHTAYAAEVHQVNNTAMFAEKEIISNAYDFEGTLKYNLLRLSGSSYPNEGKALGDLRLFNLPSTIITFDFEKVTFDYSWNFHYFFRSIDTNQVVKADVISGNYVTLNTADYKNTYLQLVLYYYSAQPDVNYTFDFKVYVYTGDYKPGYGEGYTNGYNDGKSDGLVEGSDVAQYGIFQRSLIDAQFTYDVNGKNVVINKKGLRPNYISNGINTAQIYDDNDYIIENGEEYYLERAIIKINFINPFTYSNNRPILLNGDVATIPSITFIDVTDKKYNVPLSPVENGRYGKLKTVATDEDLIRMQNISSIEIMFGRALDTFANVSIMQDNGNYSGGFTAGYNEGLSDGQTKGEEIGYDKGYNQGFKEGESEGYANAVLEGTTNLGIFSAAVSFIKIFFQLTTQFLGTKIAGDITLGLLVIGLPCAFMIVNLAIGLLKKWLGGRGASEGD